MKTVKRNAVVVLGILSTTLAIADESLPPCNIEDADPTVCNMYCGAGTSASPPSCYSTTLNGPCMNYNYISGTDSALGLTYTVPYTYTNTQYAYNSATDTCNTSDVTSSTTATGSCNDYTEGDCTNG